MAQKLLFVCSLVLITLLAYRVSSETTSPACPPWSSWPAWSEWAVISGSNCKETRNRSISREPCPEIITNGENRPCPCTSQPWNEWMPISLDPCEEERCHVGTSISDCCETRPCVRGKCQKTCRAHDKNSYCDKRKGCVCKKRYHMLSGKCVRDKR